MSLGYLYVQAMGIAKEGKSSLESQEPRHTTYRLPPKVCRFTWDIAMGRQKIRNAPLWIQYVADGKGDTAPSWVQGLISLHCFKLGPLLPTLGALLGDGVKCLICTLSGTACNSNSHPRTIFFFCRADKEIHLHILAKYSEVRKFQKF